MTFMIVMREFIEEIEKKNLEVDVNTDRVN